MRGRSGQVSGRGWVDAAAALGAAEVVTRITGEAGPFDLVLDGVGGRY